MPTIIDDEIALAGIGEVALTAKVQALLTTRSLDTIRDACRASVYWPRFRELAEAGEVLEGWLRGDGALGRVVLIWAVEDNVGGARRG